MIVARFDGSGRKSGVDTPIDLMQYTSIEAQTRGIYDMNIINIYEVQIKVTKTEEIIARDCIDLINRGGKIYARRIINQLISTSQNDKALHRRKMIAQILDLA